MYLFTGGAIMVYASVAIVAFLVIVIINYEVLNPKEDHRFIPAFKEYRRFLLGVLLFVVIDFLWGVLDANEIMLWLYVDTVLYFLSMALTVILWTHYVIKVLEDKSWFAILIHFMCQFYAVYIICILIFNFYKPVFFSYNKNNDFYGGMARVVTYEIQIFIYLIISVYTLIKGMSKKGRDGWRYLAVGSFGVEQLICIGIQIYYWAVPVYSIGCLLGTCILHTFVFEDRKMEYQDKLEKLLEINKEQKEELGSAKQAAYKDPLTGVKSKAAYIDVVEKIDQDIKDKKITGMAVAVFDLNGLKKINDTQGHEAGDIYIKNGCMAICKKFAHSPVFRIGGDEFVAILQGSDFEKREELLTTFEDEMEFNLRNGEVVVASGLSIFEPDKDETFSTVFERADKKMYECKNMLKKEVVIY